MILFQDEHVQPILRGRKTQTRRMGKKRWNIGAVHLAKTQMLSTFYFAKIKIRNVRKERLGDMSELDALKEGGYTIEEYKRVFDRINKKNGGYDPDLMVWVIDFELAYTDLKINDLVKLSPECAEYCTHKNMVFRVKSQPWWTFGNEMISIESVNNPDVYYTMFAVKFLEKIDYNEEWRQ